MNAAEEIVKHWLQSKGYFLQSSIRLRKNKEIDILAVSLLGEQRLHIEVNVSVRSANYAEDAQRLAEQIHQRKFLSVADEVGTRLGKPYKKQLVVGKVAFRNRDIREPFISECEKLGVEVLKFDDIIKEVEAQLGTHSHLNSIIKTIQLSELFLKQ